MRIIFRVLPWLILLVAGYFFISKKFSINTSVESKHQLLVEKIEAMGKLELVRYQISDVIEHKNKTDFLPEASVLLIVKAEAVGCVDLTKITREDIKVEADTAVVNLPQPEICYVKIDHESSRVYDTKMAYFREAKLVDEAYKAAEQKISSEVKKSDILAQTKTNASSVLKPIIEGLGYKNVRLTFN
ncbi:DUF4230 domain-containing protein [Pedobacter agri]|jgi:hypothetical protein|uniref:DUF4230 domain-containing protein n=1 Tax=Pedobacter agri TaxID=454586 RepID=UPI0012275C1F|nr:DUF4230 domain-containing protein [Pedobacter agri]MDQ1140032.1 hypothetical protein [Pedobacter agri]RZJ63953.1 MAG: DUF4230 domain-containing protein [Flavobacterium sp.]